MPELSDEFVVSRFKHLYEQYFVPGSIEIRRDGEGKRFLHALYAHPRFKHSWLPGTFCGLAVEVAPAGSGVKS